MKDEKSGHSAGREDRIRHRAHAIWIEAGQPHGNHEAHWAQAAKEIDADQNEESSDLPIAPENSDTVRNGIDPPKGGNGLGTMGNALGRGSDGATAPSATRAARR